MFFCASACSRCNLLRDSLFGKMQCSHGYSTCHLQRHGACGLLYLRFPENKPRLADMAALCNAGGKHMLLQQPVPAVSSFGS